MKKHVLKTINPYFQAVWCQNKNFEIRLNDREFQYGDLLILREYEENSNDYTGRIILATVSYVLSYSEFPGLAEDYACLGLKDLINIDLDSKQG